MILLLLGADSIARIAQSRFTERGEGAEVDASRWRFLKFSFVERVAVFDEEKDFKLQRAHGGCLGAKGR